LALRLNEFIYLFKPFIEHRRPPMTS
jgi:hypothetical protein